MMYEPTKARAQDTGKVAVLETGKYELSSNADAADAQGPMEAPFAVVCVKASGARVQFQRYATSDEAGLVAARLTALGCVAHVIDGDVIESPKWAA